MYCLTAAIECRASANGAPDAASRQDVWHTDAASRHDVWHTDAASSHDVWHTDAASRHDVWHTDAASRHDVWHTDAASRHNVWHTDATSRHAELCAPAAANMVGAAEMTQQVYSPKKPVHTRNSSYTPAAARTPQGCAVPGSESARSETRE